MKNTKLIYVIILLTTMMGCGGGSSPMNDGLITVDVTKKYPVKELVLQDFMDVEYIALETSDEFITSASVQAVGKDILVLRNIKNDGDILLFDRQGKGIRKINRKGQGAEEYLGMAGIILDEDAEEILVNGSYGSKIFAYDLWGNSKRSFKQRGEDYFYDLIDNFDKEHLICHDGYFEVEIGRSDVKRNFFMIVSKQDGSIKEIKIPYEGLNMAVAKQRNADGRIRIRNTYNRKLISYQNDWILTESSSDTIYRYTQDHALIPFIVRTPSIQSMNTEVLLFPGVLMDRYYFMQAVNMAYDFVADKGFSRTDLVYDRHENEIFECIVYNDDDSKKKSMSLAYEIPMFALLNKEILLVKRLETHHLMEAYEKGELKGKLKEIAAELTEDSNPVLMLLSSKK